MRVLNLVCNERHTVLVVCVYEVEGVMSFFWCLVPFEFEERVFGGLFWRAIVEKMWFLAGLFCELRR